MTNQGECTDSACSKVPNALVFRRPKRLATFGNYLLEKEKEVFKENRLFK